MPIRVVVLDDNHYVRTYAQETRPVSATFNQFVEAVARSPRVGRVSYLVPVRHLRIWEVEPALDPVDESLLDTVPMAPFGGIADRVLRAGWIAARNWRPIARAVAQADLLWLRLPASNALLALTAARRHGVPVFSWIDGQEGAVSQLATELGPSINADVQMFASTIRDEEIAETRRLSGEHAHEGPWRIAWAGRMNSARPVEELVESVRLLIERGRDVVLVVMCDGPARKSIERRLRALGQHRVEDYGAVGDRPTYMRLLREADVLVHPSFASGMPEVLIDAMAAGLPIVAVGESGGVVRDILGDGERGIVVSAAESQELAGALEELLDRPQRRQELRLRALDWVSDRTARAQAGRLVQKLVELFPDLDWSER